MAVEAVILAIGAIVSFVGGAMQADADQAAGEFNAKIDTENALFTEKQTIEDERVFRLQAREAMGSQIAGYGASGVSSVEGSAAEVIRASAAAGELDALKIRDEGTRRAKAYRDSATMSRRFGAARADAQRLSATGGLLQSGGNIYGKYGGSGASTQKTANRTPF